MAEDLTEKWQGRSIDMDLIAEIKEEALLCCNDNGYELAMVSFPEQEVTRGEIILHVSQPQVGRVTYCGNRWFSNARIENYFDVHAGDVLDQNAILNKAAWFNRNPFRSTQVVLSPARICDRADLTFCIRDRFPLRIFAGADNTGTEFTKTTRVYAGLNWGNAFSVGDLLTYQFTTGPALDDYQSHYLNYTCYLPWRHQMIVYGGYARMHPKLTIPHFHSTATCWQGSLRYTIPCGPLYQNLLHEVTFGFDFKSLNSNLLFLGTLQTVPVIAHSVNLTQAYAAYDLNWINPIHNITMKAEAFASFIQWLPNQSASSYNDLRLGATPHYIYGRLSLGDLIQLPYEWETSFLVRGQLSDAPLLPSEQFALGGNNTVRGYDENAYLADHAICANGELHTPSVSLWKKMKDRLYLIAFLDAARGWYRHTSGTFQAANLVGAGPGIRYSLPNYISARLDYGFQIHGIPGDRSWGRLHMSITASY
jgi:hemolysin activation/secretion protein